MIKLTILQDGNTLQQLTLAPGDIQTVGRKGKGADIQIDSPFVSSKHLLININMDGSIQVKDTGSSNGTFKNNRTEQFAADKLYPIQPNEKIHLTAVTDIVLVFEKVATATPQAPAVAHKQEPKSQEVFVNVNQQGVPVNLFDFLEKDNALTVGRAEDNNVRLPHPTISRNHAIIKKVGPGSYTLTDLDARNGTYVNGVQIYGTIPLLPEDVISIGPYEFRLTTPADDVISTRINTTAAIVAKDLVTTVRGGKVILNLTGITVPIPEGKMIALMGPSGCGKSTLMNALNGNFPSDADKGSVKILGFELNQRNFPYLKQFIGFVPQDDIVHRELTVNQCMWYAAKIKLPNATDTERTERIQEVLEDLRITDKHVDGITQKMVRELSGGQRKRVSIAIELLSKPSVLFLDEPTSPLDPQTIDEFLLCLKALTKGKNGEIGTTIVMVTHKPDDLVHMDKIIFMATGGNLTYYGDIHGYKSYFGVEEVKHIYGAIDSAEKGKKLSEKWKQSPEKQQLERQFSSQKEKQNTQKAKEDNPFRQTYWLARRYFSIKTNDQANTLLMLLQAPIIAGLMCMIFDKLTIGVLFMMAVSAIWFGTNNAGREIVGEIAIYLRERMFNVRIVPYLLSKMVVLSLFSLAQVLIFVSIIYFTFLQTDGFDFMQWGRYVWVMFLLSFASTMMGLLVSAVVKTNEQVMTIIPIILIPQILLSGTLDKVEGVTEWMSLGTISRWGTESYAHLGGEIATDSVCSVPAHAFYKEVYDKTQPQMRPEMPDSLKTIPDHALTADLRFTDAFRMEDWHQGLWVVIGMALLFFIITIIVLRTKDPFRKLRV